MEQINYYEYYIDALIGLLYLYFFFNERDLLKKQIAMYLFSFVLFVVFSQIIFGKAYSARHDIFTTGFESVKYIIYLFGVVLFLFTRNVKPVPKFRIKPLLKVSWFDLILASPILVFLIFYASTKGIRLSGEFLDHVGVRSIWVDYVYVYSVACIVALRGSSIVILLAILVASAHLLAAERMRAFVYIMSILIIFYNINDKKHQSSLLLLSGFFLATLLGSLRHGDVQLDQSYNVTHFGSVTISSLFLLDESILFTYGEQFKFFIGSIIANIIPSSLLAEDFNIRLFLSNSQNIPGGGWLPVWAYVMVGGYVGVSALAIGLAYFYRWIIKSKRGYLSTKHELAKYTMLVIFLATIPRWFMYTPYQVLKMPLYGYIGTFLLLSVIGAFSKRKHFGYLEKRI
jgi:hypothetical protein